MQSIWLMGLKKKYFQKKKLMILNFLKVSINIKDMQADFEYLLEDVEILNVDELKRRPEVNFLNDDLNKILKQRNIKVDVSISHISEFATSVAVINMEEEN